MRKNIVLAVVTASLFLSSAVSEADRWSEAREKMKGKAKQTVKGLGDIADQAGKDLGNVLGATVGEAMKAGNEVMKGPAKLITEVGDGASDLTYNTLNETGKFLKKTEREVGNGINMVGDYIEKDPLEAAFVIAAIAYGGYLIYTGDFIFVVKIGEASFTVAEGTTAAKSAGAIFSGGGLYFGSEGIDDEESEGSSGQAGKPKKNLPAEKEPATQPTTFQFEYVPERVYGNRIPYREMNDMEKIRYAEDVLYFNSSYPADMYETGGLPETVTIQEVKMVDALMLIRSVPLSGADNMVVRRDEKNAVKNIAAAGWEEILKGDPAGATKKMNKELIKYAFGPSIAADGTLRGRANVERLERKLEEGLGVYVKMRTPPVPEITVLDQIELEGKAVDKIEMPSPAQKMP
ncbi:hypothetical protein KC851_03630 [Candidatus Kaiserbacteria bacterium]|nr:hypothetical protein [Candidatus Kaiserbacteria bacterium]